MSGTRNLLPRSVVLDHGVRPFLVAAVVLVALLGIARRAIGTGPCSPTLARCPATGCAAPGTPDALTDTLKRRTTLDNGTAITLANAIPITFADMMALQRRADATGVRQHVHLRADERAQLHDLLPATRTRPAIGEGTAVRLAGFMIRNTTPHNGVHNSGAESVNCRLTGPANTDIHIPIVETAGGEERTGVVVEMIPQSRSPNWTQRSLRATAVAGTLVMFVGRLFFDSPHLVNGGTRAIERQPRRSSLWEIHPVVGYYECTAPNNTCTTASLTDWHQVN